MKINKNLHYETFGNYTEFPTVSREPSSFFRAQFHLFATIIITFGKSKLHKMAYEIERKFLVNGDYKTHAFKNYQIKQGYLSLSGTVVRVRIKDNQAFITIKNAPKEGLLIRSEWEYEIPLSDAEEMLSICTNSIIHKTRYLVEFGGHVFEVDEFYGANEGLVIAEIELQREDEPFERPEWLGDEVTGDVRYYNSYLSIHPYSEWK